MGRFCLFSFIFQLPFYTLVFSEWGCFFLLVRLGRGDTKDFLSQPKKVLVTLIYVICSFFSAARRTNQEAPPQLSMYFFYYSLRPMDTSPIFCVAKHPVILRDTAGRRVIVTLRLNSPRPFSSVSLATSPPDKGGIGVCAFACILIPSPFSPYCYRNFPQCYETRQGGGRSISLFALL